MYQAERIDDKLNKLIAEQMELPLDIIEKVATYQWKSAHEASYTCSSIELTDLGVFSIRPSKVKSKILMLERSKAKYERQLSEEGNSEAKIQKLNKKIESAVEGLNYVRSKYKEDGI